MFRSPLSALRFLAPAGSKLPGPLLALALGASAALGQSATEGVAVAARAASGDPISAALASADPDVLRYDQHLTFLAHPFLEGRLPGTRGMDLAMEYCEAHLRAAGLEAPFAAASGTSYRQPFDLQPVPELLSQSLSLAGLQLVAGVDYQASSLGRGSSFAGPVTFVGYSIERGPKDSGYASYAEGDDLTGQIALLLRFEPMDEEGNSQWNQTAGAWSGRSALAGKVRQAVERGASAVLVANPPGANDPRARELTGFSQGRGVVDVPVLMLSSAAAERLVARLDPAAPSWLELRRAADQGRSIRPLGGSLAGRVELGEKRTRCENVGGLLRGRGALADELVVIGAHLDHLGWGNFGSRDRERAGKAIHPGADDNASGSAALLMLAERLHRDYSNLPAGAEARSILILLFSAEESGLNGSVHYVKEPLVPLEQHALMMNFDMIGRMTDRRLSVSGLDSGVGMEEWAKPYFAASPLTIVNPESAFGGSDHLPFLQKNVPVLFGIIAEFHQDYHTPADTAEQINRVDAVEAMRLWHSLALAAALHPTGFRKEAPQGPRRPLPPLGGGPSAAGSPAPAAADSAPAPAAAPASGGRAPFPVSLGIRPGNYGEEGSADAPVGVLIESVDPSGAGAEAGLLAGDRILTWNGAEIVDVAAYANLLRGHKPGDRVRLGLQRGDGPRELEVTLREPPSAPR